jgi:PAS domain S-box-containing protein
VFDVRSFGLTDVLDCSAALRRCGEHASSVEGAARAVVEYLYEHLIDKESDRSALALVRLYKTHRFDELQADLRAEAEEVAPGRLVAPEVPCLVLLGTAGDEPAWNDRRRSRSHGVIPLLDPASLSALPLVYELTRQIGFGETELFHPDPELFFATGGQPGGVFHVPDTSETEFGPAQQAFFETYGIRSVVGFGGLLPSGYPFAVVMFAKVPITRDIADSFAPLTFATQPALLPFIERRLFDSDPEDTTCNLERDCRMARAESVALRHLLETRHEVATEQARRLEQARQEAEDRALALARSQRRLEASEATKAAILNAALDAIITMDFEGRIVDFNPAAEIIFGYRREEAVGRLLGDLLVPPGLRAAHSDGLERYRQTGRGPILGRRIETSALRSDGTEFPAELTVAAVEAGGVRSFSGHVRDITERVRTEEALREAGLRYAHIARRLQASLLPPDLPDIPGVELASRYSPGDERLDVGGDFYDAFEVGKGRWGIVLGDVMGKGVDAAATTALARHTVRAAAIRNTDPTAVLQVLNEALYRHDPDRFCTAVFAFVNPERRRQLAVASGGHPLPLLRTTDGVATVAAAGPLLGPFPDWDGRAARVTLEPGDLILFYSDGVTEARREGEEFGHERLLATVAATGAAGAEDTVRRVLDAVTAFATEPSDDVAVLALHAPPAG